MSQAKPARIPQPPGIVGSNVIMQFPLWQRIKLLFGWKVHLRLEVGINRKHFATMGQRHATSLISPRKAKALARAISTPAA